MEQLITKDSYIKDVFYRAMEALLEKQDFDDITTTEIIERSGLSRGTFYNHFHDKYELAAWKFSVLFVQSMTPHQFTSPEIGLEGYSKHIAYIYEKRKYFKSLFAYTGQNSFQNYYTQFAVEMAESIAEQSGRKLSSADYYTLSYHSDGAVQVMRKWLQADCPITVEELCGILIENLCPRVNRLFTVEKQI